MIEEIFEDAARLTAQSRYAEALKLYRRALKHAEDDADVLDCLMALGNTCRMTGDFTDAVGYYEQVVIKADQPLKTDASVGLALSKRALGFWSEALTLVDQALEFYTAEADEEGIAFCTWARAGTLRIKGDIPEAYKTFGEAKVLHKKLDDLSGFGYALCGMGGTARVKGAFETSLNHYTEANELFTRRKDSFGRAYSHCGMGNALRMMGNYDAALEHFNRAGKLYRRIGDIVSYSYTLWSIAKTFQMLGRTFFAERYLKDARKNFRKTNDPRGLIYVQTTLAENHFLHGKKQLAKGTLLKAEAAAEQWGFQVELTHVRALLSFIDGKADNALYRDLGLKLKYDTIPFNIP